MTETTKEQYVLVRRGKVQLYSNKLPDGSKPMGLVVADSHEAAMAFKKWASYEGGPTMGSPALVGSVQGETLAIHLMRACRRGATGIWRASMAANKLAINFIPVEQYKP